MDGVDPDAAPNGVPRCDRRVGASRYRGTGNRQSRIRGRRARWHVSTRRPARSHVGCRPVDDRGGRGARARSCAAARTRPSDAHFRPDRARRGIDRRSRRHEWYGDRGDRASRTRRRCRDHHRHRHVDHRSARAVLAGCRPAVRAAPRRRGRESNALADELAACDGVRGAQSSTADGSRTGRHQRPRPRGTGAGRESRRAFARERPAIGLRLARCNGDAGCAGESDRCLRWRAAPVRGSVPAAGWKRRHRAGAVRARPGERSHPQGARPGPRCHGAAPRPDAAAASGETGGDGTARERRRPRNQQPGSHHLRIRANALARSADARSARDRADDVR